MPTPKRGHGGPTVFQMWMVAGSLWGQQEAQKREAQIFEKGKSTQNGYHFLSVQYDPDSDDVEGFWLLREFDECLS